MWCRPNFWVYGRNPVVWPFKWNLFGSTFSWYHLFFNTSQNKIWEFSWILICHTLGSFRVYAAPVLRCLLMVHLTIPGPSIGARGWGFPLQNHSDFNRCCSLNFSLVLNFQTSLVMNLRQRKIETKLVFTPKTNLNRNIDKQGDAQSSCLKEEISISFFIWKSESKKEKARTKTTEKQCHKNFILNSFQFDSSHFRFSSTGQIS